MYRTVVVDGVETTTIAETISEYTISDTTGEVSVEIDGDADLMLVESADCGLEFQSDGEVGIVTEVQSYDVPTYDGEYVVTPTMEQQTLMTKNKMMTDNVQVKKIPLYETTNLSGGTTVYIAMGEG